MTRRSAYCLVLGVCLALAPNVPVFAQSSPLKADGAVIKGYITHLAADAQQGRRTLTPGYEKMADRPDPRPPPPRTRCWTPRGSGASADPRDSRACP